MKFGMFYPVAVASEADLGKGLWGLDRDRYDDRDRGTARAGDRRRRDRLDLDDVRRASLRDRRLSRHAQPADAQCLSGAAHQAAAAGPDGAGAAELESAAARRRYRDGRPSDRRPPRYRIEPRLSAAIGRRDGPTLSRQCRRHRPRRGGSRQPQDRRRMVRGDAPLLDRGSLGLSGRIHFRAAEGS